MSASDKKRLIVGVVLGGFVLVTWFMGLFVAPVDMNQGEVYRIIYLHVPAAFTAFAAAAALLINCIMAMAKKSETWLNRAKAYAEVGLAFTILTLATGSIWGKPTWNTWWTWDARLTTTFILALLYAGWLFLHGSLQIGTGRITSCAVLGILIAIDVPVIYKSVTWWRTLHQPPSLLRKGGSTMSPEIRNILLLAVAALILFGIWLASQRARNLEEQDKIEAQSLGGGSVS